MRILELSVDEYKDLENMKDLGNSKIDKLGLTIKDGIVYKNNEFISIKTHNSQLLITKDFICFL